MATLSPRYSKEEFARRGQAIYENSIRDSLGKEDEGKFIAIDIESGSYEIDRDDFTATDRLLARKPDAQIWLLREGHPTAYRIGAGRSQPGNLG